MGRPKSHVGGGVQNVIPPPPPPPPACTLPKGAHNIMDQQAKFKKAETAPRQKQQMVLGSAIGSSLLGDASQQPASGDFASPAFKKSPPASTVPLPQRWATPRQPQYEDAPVLWI